MLVVVVVFVLNHSPHAQKRIVGDQGFVIREFSGKKTHLAKSWEIRFLGRIFQNLHMYIGTVGNLATIQFKD